MNLRIRNGKYVSRQIVKELSTKYDHFDDNLPIEDFYELHSSILRELIRVSHIVFYNIQIVTGSKRAFFKIIREFHENLKDVIIWDKKHAEPSISNGVLNRQSELILIFEDESKAISRQFDNANFPRGSVSDIWAIGRGKKITDSHRAVFPEELSEKIILNFTQENDIVYDPFMGTGTSLVTCAKYKRRYIGSEINKECCELARKRIRNLQPDIFDKG